MLRKLLGPLTFGKVVAYFILGLWTLLAAWIIGWIVIASLSTTREIFTNKLLASGFHFDTYVKVFINNNVGRYFINSIIYVFSSLILILLISAPASYVLSRVEFPGKSLLRTMFVAGMGIPGTMLLIPLFSVMIFLKLTGTLYGLILVYIGTSIPFTVFFLTGFFSTLPKELEEAARIDGCTDIGVFWRIMLPLAQPGLITVAVFNFMGLWNDYFWALVFANSAETRPLSLGLQAMVQSMRYTGDYAGIFAAVIIVFLPTFILYIFLSEKIISGITAGAVKA
jgi:N-acetylglucosamine transport system permease protein